jgi:hypothetical protein
MRIEPKTIIRFTLEYFDIIRDMFDAHVAEGLLKQEHVAEIFLKHNRNIEAQMLEYKLMRRIGNDFDLRSEYLNFLKFILEEFRPLLPEHIEKYNYSISELFRKIKDEIFGDKDVLDSRVKNISNEIREFVTAVEHNTISLLEQTRALKANLEKVDYREKVQRASFWIDYYILPLNRILDVTHKESVISKLYNISEFVNNKRLNFYDENTRQSFESLYFQLIQTNDDLLKQSRILTNELLPLIERIRTESTILTGFITFLRNPYKTPVPKMFKRKNNMVLSSNAALNAKAFMEQFAKDDTIYLVDLIDNNDKWIFDIDYFKGKLREQLPVNNFFDWAATTLEKEYTAIESDKLFALTTLLFEEDLQLEFDEKKKNKKIKTDEYTLKVPNITVSNYGIF